MFKIYYLKNASGYKAGATKNYTTSGRAYKPMALYMNQFVEQKLTHKVSDWMTIAQKQGKQRGLTVGEIIRIEYFPN